MLKSVFRRSMSHRIGEKKMSKNKITTMIMISMMLTIAFPLFALPTANAHDPVWIIPTYTYLTATPNPVGIGQSVSLVFWLDKYPPTAAGVGGDRVNFTVTVMAPNGDKKTLGTYVADPVASANTAFTPDQAGTYVFEAIFPGLVLTGYNPVTGIPGTLTNAYINDKYLPSNSTATITVQEQAIPDPPTYPLPTEYWMRPIEGQNTQWYQISSNWLAGAQIVQKVQAYGIAPNSAHVMWAKSIRDGGVVGGGLTGENGMTFYDGTQYENTMQNPVVMNGRLYYTLPKGSTSGDGGYVCVDLLTGETLWTNTLLGTTGVAAPTFGQLYWYDSMNQHGVIPNGYLWTNNFASAYDPLTGGWLFNLTGVPSGTEVYTEKGEIVRYVLNTAGKSLGLWNNTCEQQGLHGALGNGSSAYQWRPVGKSVNMTNAYSWSISLSWLPAGAAIAGVIHDDVLLGRNGSLPALGVSDPYTMWAVSLKPESRGQLLWMKNYNPPEGNLTRSFRFIDPVNRVFVFWDKETIAYSCYDLDTGDFLWTTPSENAWNLYAGGGGSIWTQTTAYGKLYSTGYSGIVYCYDTRNGSLLWSYSTAAQAGYATPYGGYPLGIAGVADEKIYLHVNEHSSGAPYWKGAELICLNAETGEKVWSIAHHGASGYVPWGYAIADGYLIAPNLFDMRIYAFGKGPSATTVTASPKVSTYGNNVLIEGTVIDTAAGTKQGEQAARFPAGVPAVSDDSMSAWMEYVYMQKPKPTNATGVLLSIDVIDGNGNYRNIGTTTSDAEGFYSLEWTPDIAGKYTVIATFAGSESYWPSDAETAFTVSEPAPTQTPTIEHVSVADQYLVPGIIVIVVAIAIVGAILALLLLRKRP
jgi:outer membrane protein assembly factor BamB